MRNNIPGVMSLIIALMCSLSGQAQFQVRDSVLFDPHITIGMGVHDPQLDLAHRFGRSGSPSLGFHIKTRKNWYFGIEGNYIFGDKVNEPGLLSNLYTDNGEILDDQGQIAIMYIQERGWSYFLDGGKIFNVFGPNKNSGLLAYGGVGYMQHKIRIEHQATHIYALEGDYLHGYDRFASGPASKLYLGYFHMSNRRLVNFTVGLEYMQGWCTPRRTLNFDTQQQETGVRKDGLLGIRVGWTFHMYSRTPNDFYLQ